MVSGSSATFSLKSFSAPTHTRSVCLSFSCKSDSFSPALYASLASRGSIEGRWSMLMTERGVVFWSSLTSTNTDGFVNVVLTV